MLRSRSSSLRPLFLLATLALAACGGDGAPATPNDADTSDAGLDDGNTAPADATADASDGAPTTADAAPDADDGASYGTADAGDAGDADAGHATDAGDAGHAGDASDAGDETDAEDAGNAADAADAGTPLGTYLVPGNNLDLVGITSDNFVIYSKVNTVYAVALTGGTPRLLFQLAPYSLPYVEGPAVYAYLPSSAVCSSSLGTYPAGDLPTLTAWTSAHGVVVIANCAEQGAGGAFLSPDDSAIAYQAYGDTTVPAWEMYVTTLDGATTKEVKASPQCQLIINGHGAPTGRFAGNGAFLTQETCQGDGGTQYEQDSLFAPSSLSFVASFQGHATFDPTGAVMWVQFDGGGGALVRTSDGTTIASDPSATGYPSFDPTGAWLWLALAPTTKGVGAQLRRTSDGVVVASDPNEVEASFDASGTYCYYASAGALKRITLSDTPTTTILVPSGAGSYPWLDPNGPFLLDPSQSVAGAGDAGPTTGCYLLASAADAPLTLLSDDGYCGPFTSDGNYVFSWDQSSPLGDLFSFPTSAPAPSLLATGIGYLALLSGSKAVAASVGGLIVDASGNAPPWMFTPTLTKVLPTPDKTAIAYTTTTLPWGLYAVSVP